MMNHQNPGAWFIKPNGLKETVNLSPDPAGAAGAVLLVFQNSQIIAAILNYAPQQRCAESD